MKKTILLIWGSAQAQEAIFQYKDLLNKSESHLLK